jgi:hypothetical protein
MAEAGHHDQATTLAEQAETATYAITDRNEQATTLIALAQAEIKAGLTQRAGHSAAIAARTARWSFLVEVALALEPTASETVFQLASKP